jgi:dual specificity protein kinase YAK1
MKNNYCGLTLKTIGFILKQILEGIYQFSKINIIHCDLKPENILIKLKKSDDINIKITDFGSACFKKHTIATYIQSRYYRAPEVLVTYGYSAEIDMWSLGCVAAELFIGNPFFPGCNEFDQLLKIISICGPLPGDMTANCAKREKFYKIDNQTKYPRIKTKEEYYQVSIIYLFLIHLIYSF